MVVRVGRVEFPIYFGEPAGFAQGLDVSNKESGQLQALTYVPGSTELPRLRPRRKAGGERGLGGRVGRIPILYTADGDV